MKNFVDWLKEDAPANCAAGGGVRGMGYVTDPNGTATNAYIVGNQQDPVANGDTINDVLKQHQAIHADRIQRNFS